MDFDDGHMQRCGCGEYLPMDPDLLALDGRPGLLHVMYANNPSDSGAVHADVRQRWTRGDEDVRRCMAEVAECARKGRWVNRRRGGCMHRMQSSTHTYGPCSRHLIQHLAMRNLMHVSSQKSPFPPLLKLPLLTMDFRAALEQRDVAQLARLINRNFDLRREMFGDVVSVLAQISQTTVTLK